MVALRQPHRQQHKRSAIIEDLLEMAQQEHHEAIRAIIAMLTDLHQNQLRECQYAKKLRGLPVWELKSHARGGAKGGGSGVLFRAE